MTLLRKPTVWYRATLATDGGIVLPPETDAPNEDRKVHLYNGSAVDVELYLLPDGVATVNFAGQEMTALEASQIDAALRSMDALLPTLAGGKALPFPLRISGRQAIIGRAAREVVELSVCVEYRRGQ